MLGEINGEGSKLRIDVSRALAAQVPWGDPRLKSGAPQRQILKSLKWVPRHPFEEISPISSNVSKASKAYMAQI